MRTEVGDSVTDQKELDEIRLDTGCIGLIVMVILSLVVAIAYKVGVFDKLIADWPDWLK